MSNTAPLLEQLEEEQHNDGGVISVLGQVREHVGKASELLRSLGPQQERVAWLLEDALMFLDESFEEEE